MPKLVVFRGDAIEAELVLTGRTVRIGRDAQNDLVVNDATNGVSRFHAEIRAEGGIYTIVDLNSRNGLWVNHQRVPSAVLKLGSPVTIGACELMLEDESGLSDLGDAKLGDAKAVSSTLTAPLKRDNGPQGAMTPAASPAPAKPAPDRAGKQRALLWAGAAVAVLAVVVSIAVRSKPKEAPPITATREAPPPPAPAPSPPVDSRTATQIAIDKHLTDVVDQMNRQEFDAAIRDHLDLVLALDPQNSEATRLKTQALDEMAKMAKAKLARPPRPPKSPEVVVVAVPGIPKLANETPREYADRAKRIQDKYAQGKRELEQKQFAAAVNSFQAVEQDLANYSDVRALLADTAAQRSAAVREAMDGGAQNETAGRLNVALQWYQRAQLFDPTSAAAAEKVRTVRDRMVKDATALLERADTLVTLRKNADALKLYLQIVESLPEGLELRDRAQQKIKALK